MKNKAQKQSDLNALAEKLGRAQGAMLVGFNKLNASKDLELRNQLREAGVEFEVVKNTIARRAAENTQFAQVSEHLKGVSALATTTGDPVGLSKAISKFTKANPEIFTFKVGIVEGKVVNLDEVDRIASLPSKEVLISRVMYLINCQAQRLATVLSAVPRNLAVVVKQVGEQKSES